MSEKSSGRYSWDDTDDDGIIDFSEEQVRQIGAVRDAAENLIRVLLTKPEYLKDSPLTSYYKNGDELPPIYPSEVADVVADMIIKDSKGSTNVFFPARIERHNDNYEDVEEIRDTLNAYPNYNIEGDTNNEHSV